MTLWVKDWRYRIGLVLLGIAVLVIVWVSPYQERIEQQRLTVTEADFSEWGSSRGTLWLTSVQLIEEKTWLGHGPGGAEEAAISHLPLAFIGRKLAQGDSIFAPHNIFLSFAVEIGLLGLLAFLILLIAVAKPLWDSLRHQKTQPPDLTMIYLGQAIGIGLVALLAQGMGISIHLDKYLWLLLGMSVAFVRISRGKEEELVS
jgi:O-antigen ligase